MERSIPVLVAAAALVTTFVIASPAAAADPPTTDTPNVASQAIPPEGIGMIVGGAVMTAGGIGLVAYGLGPRVCDTCDGQRNAAWVGLALIPPGAGLLGGGAHLKRRFNRWRDATGVRPPKRGNGLFVGGGTLVAFGALGFAMTPGNKRAAILGALWTAGGAAMLAAGGVLRHRYRGFKTARAEIAFAPVPLRRGAGATVHMRW